MEEHILVGLSSAPSNARIIRTAATMAAAFGCKFTALFVRTPGYDAMSEENKERLRTNTELAKSLGATVETVFGDDVSYQIAEYARLSGVTKIVVGRSAATRKHPWGKPTLTEKLTAIAPNLDIHISPDASVINGSDDLGDADPAFLAQIITKFGLLLIDLQQILTEDLLGQIALDGFDTFLRQGRLVRFDGIGHHVDMRMMPRIMERGVPAEVLRRNLHLLGDHIPVGAEQVHPGIG